jgi:hypothetical protein
MPTESSAVIHLIRGVHNRRIATDPGDGMLFRSRGGGPLRWTPPPQPVALDDALDALDVDERRARRWPWIAGLLALALLGVAAGVFYPFGAREHAAPPAALAAPATPRPAARIEPVMVSAPEVTPARTPAPPPPSAAPAPAPAPTPARPQRIRAAAQKVVKHAIKKAAPVAAAPAVPVVTPASRPDRPSVHAAQAADSENPL